jgi:ankyrin repeat protein
LKASSNGHLEIVKLLLQNGADINDKVRKGSSKETEEGKLKLDGIEIVVHYFFSTFRLIE